MLDDELREQLAEWVRPVTTLPVPGIRVLRRRARRRGMGRAAAAAVAAAVIAAAAVGVVVSLPGTGRPAGGRPVASQAASPGIVVHGWQPAGPLPAADAGPAAAPYIVIPGWGGDGTAQVRNILAGQTIVTIQPLPGQYVEGAAAAGDDRTFVLQAEVGGQQQEVNGRKVGPPRNAPTVAFDELRLGPDGRPVSLVSLLTVPARDALSGFAISQDASMLAYANPQNSGFETVSLATGTHRSWAPVDSGTVAPYSLSWAGDQTLAFEWTTGNNLHPPGLGLRLLDVAAPGNLLQASRLVVPYGQYCAATRSVPGWPAAHPGRVQGAGHQGGDGRPELRGQRGGVLRPHRAAPGGRDADDPHAVRRAALRTAVDRPVGRAGGLVLRGARRTV